MSKSKEQLQQEVERLSQRVLELEAKEDEHKLAEEALQESETRYRDFYDNAPDLFISVDAATAKIKRCNLTLLRALGYSKEEIVGQPVFMVYHPDSLKRAKEAFELFSTKGKVENAELQLRRKDGSTIDVSLNVSSVRDAEGNIIESRSVWRDISVLKQAEKRLAEHERRSLAWLEHSSICTKIVDLDFNLQFMSRAGIEGLRIDDITPFYGKPYPFDFYPESFRNRMTRNLEKARDTGAVITQEAAVVDIDGGELWFHSTLIPVNDERDRLDYIMVISVDITERKQAEKALMASEEKYRQLAESPPAIVFQFMMSQDGTFSFPYINKKVQQIVGVSAEEVMLDSTALFGKIHPDDEETFQTEILKSAKGIEPFQATVRFLKDKETRWIDVRSTPVALPEGGMLWNGYVTDITENKQNEEALARQTEETTALLQAARVVLEEKDFKTSARSIFDACRELTGATAGYVALLSDDGQENEVLFLEAGGRPCSVDPELPMPIRGLRATSYKTGKAVHENDFSCSEWMGFMPEGHVHLGNVMFAPLNIDGKTVGIMGLANKPTDFTDRDVHLAEAFGGLAAIALRNARANETLYLSAKKWQNTFDSMSDLTCLLSPDHEFIEVNQAICDTLGLEREELLGRKCYELVHGTTEPIPECPCVKLSKNKQAQSSQYTQDGRHYELLAWPILNERDEMWAYVHVVRDTTERIELEEQLRQSQKMEAVGRLAGGVAHDFNNMLGAILGYGDMIMEQVDPQHPVHNGVKQIIKAAERSADLTRQLLAFARKQTVSPKVLNLNTVVDGMTNMLQRLIGEDIDLVWKPRRELHQVRVDPSQIDQILVNLCVNARDAITDVGKVTIETQNVVLDEDYCAERAGFAPGAYITLAVIDTGRGMTSETMNEVFEPFFTTKEVGKGTGLGLSTVYGIVKQNNGFIGVNSKLGEGTTFTIYVPQYLSRVSQTKEMGPGQPVEPGHETILLVEDEPTILELTTMMLEKLGYIVMTAQNPGEALKLAREHLGEIHLLMTDVVMPEMNGRDLAKNVQSSYPNIKCLFMSGYTADVIAHHGILEEGVNFLQKPFRKDILAAEIRKVLDRK